MMINVDELWLKGGNRPHYQRVLKDHIKEVFKAYGIRSQFENTNQRVLITMEGEITEELISSLKSKVSNVAYNRQVLLLRYCLWLSGYDVDRHFFF